MSHGLIPKTMSDLYIANIDIIYFINVVYQII